MDPAMGGMMPGGFNDPAMMGGMMPGMDPAMGGMMHHLGLMTLR